MLELRVFVLLACSLYFTLVSSVRLNARDVDGDFLDCYDYIVVGGGISGLVVANRLTEDPNVTVLLLEAGNLDNYEETILNPIEDGHGLGTKYDWNLFTAPQKFLDGHPRPYDMGRGVGGGSLINGMCWTRGGSADFDAWEALGNPGWGWNDLLPYFKKAIIALLLSENYSDNVDAESSRELYIKPDPGTHGTDGYIHVSYPRYFYNQSTLVLKGLEEMGIPILTDPNNGTASGAMLIPNSISPDNQTRSDARLGYFDGFIDSRPNFHVATGKHVYRLLMDKTNSATRSPDGLLIKGVEFVPDGTLSVFNVTASKEVILAAGAVHTPQILELSGIGDSEVLSKYGIPVQLHLPGVGNNFQDHPYVGVVYYVSNPLYLTLDMIYHNPGLLAQAERQYYVNKTGPWTAGAINTVAFPSLPSSSKNWTSMIADASSQHASKHLLPHLDSTIVAGYKEQKKVLTKLLSRRDVGAYEILSDNIGLLSVAAMHTFSRGSVHIQSQNPLTQPLIDPRYCSNPLDCQILAEALLFNNRLLNTRSMRELESVPYYPFLQNATVESLIPAILSGIRTEFHGTGTTSMLPLEYGGVVDSHLRVYGTRNLRIVDAGIFPLVPAAHLQASVYAAADIIKADDADTRYKHCTTSTLLKVPKPTNDTVALFVPQTSMVNGTFSTFRTSAMTKGSSTLTSSSLPEVATQTPQEQISTDPSSQEQVPIESSVEQKNPFLKALNLLLAGLVPGETELASMPEYSLTPQENPATEDSEEEGTEERSSVAKSPINAVFDFFSGLVPGRGGGFGGSGGKELVGGFGADAKNAEESTGEDSKGEEKENPIPPVMSVLREVMMDGGDTGRSLLTTPTYEDVVSTSTISSSESSTATIDQYGAATATGGVVERLKVLELRFVNSTENIGKASQSQAVTHSAVKVVKIGIALADGGSV
ncbi:hypothetical protein HYALB_00005158 [Hymenoscyphus albidus]|uniref:Glucose-methanol-choline oxidoreductase N-terminal domain-containing protein n=1 Tax=Hymenoscyphus albidus TaxID=595503 RepID=A0A9N9LRH6_9HELO|nr:hypothetical protein HYALB_00005158 [Hymenoscyphus albidus]